MKPPDPFVLRCGYSGAQYLIDESGCTRGYEVARGARNSVSRVDKETPENRCRGRRLSELGVQCVQAGLERFYVGTGLGKFARVDSKLIG